MDACGDLELATARAQCASVPGGTMRGRGRSLQAAQVKPWLIRYEPAMILSELGWPSTRGLCQDSRYDGAGGRSAERRNDPRYSAWTLVTRA